MDRYKLWSGTTSYLKGRRTLQLKKANLSVQNVQLDVLMSSLLSLNQRVSMEATSDSRFAGEARPSTANQLHALRLCGGVAGQQGSSASPTARASWKSPDSKGVRWRRRRTARRLWWGVAGQQGRRVERRRQQGRLCEASQCCTVVQSAGERFFFSTQIPYSASDIWAMRHSRYVSSYCCF
jgi:hypothetical protein